MSTHQMRRSSVASDKRFKHKRSITVKNQGEGLLFLLADRTSVDSFLQASHTRPL